jgi:adenylosuccinate synthase
VDSLADAVQHNVDARNRLIGESHMEASQVLDELRAAWVRMAPWVKDVSLFLARARRAGQSIMFEGAQGTLLDIDHGTYPYVTSSNATVGGVCTGLGIPPKAIDGVIGVAKAYTTRVGEGPLPTELHGELGNRLRESGQEFGAVTGRPRRCGWFDAVAVRYAVRVNGLDALAITKLDVLDGMEELQICTGYRCGGAVLTEFPSEIVQLAACEPVYEPFEGWREPTRGVRRFSALPRRAQAYISRLEELTGVPAAILSTGSAREDTILREHSVADQWGLQAVAG